MNVLEKILEEIKERIKKLKEADNMCRVNAERNRNFESVKYFQSLMFATERAESVIGDIIRSHMDEAENDGWISVEERLPEEENERYYPMLNVATSYGAVKWGFYRVRDKQWYIYSEIHDEFIEARDKEIVAWQPLPNPYKGE